MSHGNGFPHPPVVMMVMPVYNEKENILEMISNISEARGASKNWDLQVLFVDDSSPDGTADEIREIMKSEEWISLLERPEKEGLGVAYINGFRHALEIFSPDYVGQMDSDLSHNPTDITPMMESLSNGSNVAIGSRYTSGGSIQGWPLKRRVISRGANLVARIFGGIIGVKDCTAGFRIIESSLLRKALDSTEIPVVGYSFQIHLLHALIANGAKVGEVPIIFKERVNGISKLGNGDIFEYFFSVSKLRMKKYK